MVGCKQLEGKKQHFAVSIFMQQQLRNEKLQLSVLYQVKELQIWFWSDILVLSMPSSCLLHVYPTLKKHSIQRGLWLTLWLWGALVLCNTLLQTISATVGAVSDKQYLGILWISFGSLYQPLNQNKLKCLHLSDFWINQLPWTVFLFGDIFFFLVEKIIDLKKCNFQIGTKQLKPL